MRWNSVTRSILLSSLAVLFVVASVWAQVGTTSIRGVVTDKTGAAIVGARVTLVSSAQSIQREMETTQSGEYEFLALPPGTYTLTVAMASFRNFEHKNIQLLVNSPATVNATLEIGVATETVEVSAQAVALNTTDASLGV